MLGSFVVSCALSSADCQITSAGFVGSCLPALALLVEPTPEEHPFQGRITLGRPPNLSVQRQDVAWAEAEGAEEAVESLGALSVAKGVQAGASFAPAGARPGGVLGIAPSRLDLSRGDGVPAH